MLADFSRSSGNTEFNTVGEGYAVRSHCWEPLVLLCGLFPWKWHKYSCAIGKQRASPRCHRIVGGCLQASSRGDANRLAASRFYTSVSVGQCGRTQRLQVSTILTKIEFHVFKFVGRTALSKGSQKSLTEKLQDRRVTVAESSLLPLMSQGTVSARRSAA
jgi:hypothetical protein